MIENPRVQIGLLKEYPTNWVETIPEEVMETIRNWCVNYLILHYEVASDHRANLAYHDSAHSLRVARDTVHILRLVQSYQPSQISDRDIQLGEIAGLTHDLIQQWGTQTSSANGFIKIEKYRKTGFNEKASAAIAIRIMKDINEYVGREIFTNTDFYRINAALLATVPVYDPVLQTIYQDYLALTDDPLAIALALADLGGGAIGGRSRYQMEGDALFRELNDDIAILTHKGIILSAPHMESIRNRILDWSRGQIAFASGRKVLSMNEIAKLPPNARIAVSDFMSRWDEAIAGAEEKLRARQKMSFGHLMADIGYHFPN